jgi:hypothetical protein
MTLSSRWSKELMNYSTAISKRRRGKRLYYVARLIYADARTGLRKEKSKTVPSSSEAKRAERDLVDEFMAGGQTAVESHEMNFANLVKHCKDTRYCEAQFDNEDHGCPR